MSSRKIYIVVFAFMVLFATLVAQVIIVPLETQLPIIKKILEFDKSSKNYADQNKSFKIGIIFQSAFKISNSTRYAIQNISEDQHLTNYFGKNVEFVPIDLTNNSDLNKAISTANLRVAIITPLRAYSLEKVSSTLKSNKVLSISLVPDYLEYNISIGIDYRGEKPQILMNTISTREENADFNPQILKLVKVIK